MGSVVSLRTVPDSESRTVKDSERVVPSRKGKRHADVRTREHLTPGEVDKLIARPRPTAGASGTAWRS